MENNSVIKIYDKYGVETGQHSTFLKTYGARQEVILGILDETSTDNNMSNDFKEFERMQAEILKVQFQDMLINLFTYTNVPPTLNIAQLETTLRSFGGGVCVGKDDSGDIVILGRSDELGYNVYGDIMPSYFDSSNYLSNKKVITPRNLNGDYVAFYNKQSFLDFYSTDFQIVNHYCKMLATIKATERMNWLQMRSPYIIKGQKNGVNSQILLQKILSGEIAIDVDMDANIEGKIAKVDLSVPDRTSSLQTAYRNTTNEMLTLFGVYNNPDQKKERMISGEASANNHVIEGMGDIYYNARRHAVNLLNLAFGTEIEVQWNSTVATMFRNIANSKNLGV